MSSFRNTAEFIAHATGQVGRRIRGMLSRRDLDHDRSEGNRVRAIGREALDGSAETLDMDAFAPVGILGRPSGNATVEAAVGFVGSDGAHPIALSFLDHGRRAVIDAVGLDADETLIYTSALVIKLTADGKIELRTTGGTAVALALKSDVDSLKAQVDALQAAYNAHTHAYAPGPGAPVPTEVPVPTSAASSTVTGSTVVLVE